MSLERLTVPQSMEVLKEVGEMSQEETEATLKALTGQTGDNLSIRINNNGIVL